MMPQQVSQAWSVYFVLSGSETWVCFSLFEAAATRELMLLVFLPIFLHYCILLQ